MADEPTPQEPEGGTDPQPQGGDKTFTQADVDRIVGERLQRERAKLPDNLEDLQRKAQEFDQLAEQNKTELQKAQERADQAESRVGSFESELRKLRLTTAVAKRRDVVDVDAAVALLPESKIEWDEDGQPKNTETVLDELLEQKQFLRAGEPSRDPDFAAGVREPTEAGSDMNKLIRRGLGRPT